MLAGLWAFACVALASLRGAAPPRKLDVAFWGVLKSAVERADGKVFVQAGDLTQMWLRDSTASVHHWFSEPRALEDAAVQRLLRGLARQLEEYGRRDPMCAIWEPYDNGRMCRNAAPYTDFGFEAESPVYALRFFRHMRAALGYVADTRAVEAFVSALTRNVHANGMLWSKTRPSDDAVPHGYYNVPINLFASAELKKLTWSSARAADSAGRLHTIIDAAVRRRGVRNGRYCYEVSSTDCRMMDDANVPSLLSIPYLADGDGALFDAQVYAATRRWVLSGSNPYYYCGPRLCGVGSPHTAPGYAWPMAVAVAGLTGTAEEMRAALAQLERVPSEAMPESVHVHTGAFTRNWFDWPNALYCELARRESNPSPRARSTSYSLWHSAPLPPRPRTAAEDGWVTCAFDGEWCSFPGVADVRYGVAFAGFAVSRRSGGVHCGAALGDPPAHASDPLLQWRPYHCAVRVQRHGHFGQL